MRKDFIQLCAPFVVLVKDCSVQTSERDCMR